MTMTMNVLAVLSEKGGAGKTTTVVHVAVAAMLAGQDVAVLDLDPQASAADWCDRRGSKPEGVTLPVTRLTKVLADLEGNDTDLAIIDTPREANNIAFVAALEADLVLVPLQPGGFDYRALIRTLEICYIAKKTPFVVLNGIRPGAHRIAADARETVAETVADHNRKHPGSQLTCEVAPIVLHKWEAFRVASITTKTVLETDPDSAAAAEVKALRDWIGQQLALSTMPQREKATA